MFGSYRVKSRLMIVGWLSLILVLPAWASEHAAEPAEGAVPKTIYIPLKPPFVVNYGGVGRLHYMKIEVSLKVSDEVGANAIRHHMPYIRNNLVLLFSKQDLDQMDTQEGKELMRKLALEEITTILKAEEGESKVEDLYFNQLVIQK